MTPISIGDLAQSFLMRRQNTVLKEQMNRLTLELSSGQAADLSRHLSGHFAVHADIEHDLQVQGSYRVAANEAQYATATMQTALDQIQTRSSELGSVAVSAGTLGGQSTLLAIADQGLNTLDGIVAALNIDIGNRSLFSGEEVSQAPLVTAEDLLTELRAVVTGATTAADVITALDTFFDAGGGGFETLIYHGGTAGLAPYQLGEGESVNLDLRADDPALREIMKQTALAALANDAALSVSSDDRFLLAKTAGERLLTGQEGLTAIRANLGFAEARIDQSASRISAHVSSLEIARSELISIDPFEVATELETVQNQLEILYTLTARTSRLSLVNFLS